MVVHRHVMTLMGTSTSKAKARECQAEIRDSIERDWKLINQHQSTILGIHTMASRGS